jgi:small-conductance mechanosensitive channel
MRRFYHGLLAMCVLCAVLVGALGFPIRLALAQAEDAAAAPSAEPEPSASAAPPPASASARPVPSASPAASAAPSSSAAVRVASTEIKVREKSVFSIRASRGGRSPAERARAANSSIEALLAHPDELGDVHFEETQGGAVIYVGKTPIVTLGPEDVEASGEASLGVLAAEVTSRLSDAIATERKRSAIATTVFSFSLLVFSALIAFLLLGRTSDVAARLRARFVDDPERIGALRVGKVEFISAGAARGALTVGLTLAYRVVQIAIAYGWLIFGLSLFEATRGYTERLTGAVVKPIYGLAARIAGALPLLLVAAIAVVAISVLIRFVGLFFDSVARGDTRLGLVPRDLARPTSALVRFGIIVFALALASPMITGESDGALSRAGLVALMSVALASTPLLASAIIGVTVVFGRRFAKGDTIEIGGRSGKVTDVTLLDVRLEDESLAQVSVPHLVGLWHPMRIHKHAPLTTLEIVVDPSAPQADVERALFEAARQLSGRGRVELVYLDDAGAHWRVISAAMRHEVSLASVVQEALRKLGVGLGSTRKKNDEKGDGAAEKA